MSVTCVAVLNGSALLLAEAAALSFSIQSYCSNLSTHLQNEGLFQSFVRTGDARDTVHDGKSARLRGHNQAIDRSVAHSRSDMLWSLSVNAEDNSIVSCASLPVRHDRSVSAASKACGSCEQATQSELMKLEGDIEGHALYTAVQQLLERCELSIARVFQRGIR